MKNEIVFAKNVETSKPVGVDIDYLIEHRMQVLGNSGSGKSRIVRCLCEKSKGRFQQILISPKNEMLTLREKFDYIHVGKSSEISKPDIELNTRYAGQLALKILETGVDAIIEFSEAPLERVKFVRNFVEALMSAPAHLWHPVMIVIDEIDIWAPERGHGEAESLQAIVDLAARGRDKGFFLIAVTQKLAKFNKDVASELDIKLVGKVSLDNDQTRAATELGIPLKKKGELRWLGAPNFYFYAFGPGLSDEVIKIQSLPVETTHISGYKRNKDFKPIPTPAKIRQITTQFADLPQEAEKEIKTKEDAQKRIRELEGELRVAHAKLATAKTVDPNILEKVKHDADFAGYNRGVRDTQKGLTDYAKRLENYLSILHKRIKEIQKNATLDDLESVRPPALDSSKIVEAIFSNHTKPTQQVVVHAAPSTPPKPQTLFGGGIDDDLSNSEKKVLVAILQSPDHRASRAKVAVVCEYALGGGGFQNILSKLKTKGYVTYQGDDLIAEEKAIISITDYERIPIAGTDILRLWQGKLGNSNSKVLTTIYNAYPNSISRSDLAEQTGYTESGGGFQNILSKLRTLCLIEYLPDRSLIATKELMGT